MPADSGSHSESSRLLSLDVFRGATIAAMLLVNNPGSWSHVYAPLRHAEWHGWTPTDLIFPFFLFIVGITTWISLESRVARNLPRSEIVRDVARRGVIIILLGLLLHAFPFATVGSIDGVGSPGMADRIADRFSHLRIPGVLQRIGLCYLVAAFIALPLVRRRRSAWPVAIAAASIVVAYAVLLELTTPGSGPVAERLMLRDDLLSARLDRAIFGIEHLWSQSRTWDPEGLLTTLPAIATTLAGVCAGWLIRTADSHAHASRRLVSWGIVATVAGLLWGAVLPINKNIWTSSYVVFTAGAAALLLAGTIRIVDVAAVRRGTLPFVVFGVNPILAFVGSGLMARLIYSLIRVEWDGRTVAIQRVVHDTLFASWMSPRAASLAFAISFVALWFLLLLPLYRKRIFLRV